MRETCPTHIYLQWPFSSGLWKRCATNFLQMRASPTAVCPLNFVSLRARRPLRSTASFTTFESFFFPMRIFGRGLHPESPRKFQENAIIIRVLKEQLQSHLMIAQKDQILVKLLLDVTLVFLHTEL